MNSGSRFALAHPERPVDGALFLDLVGPLRLIDREGLDLTPRSRKAQGLLALVGTSSGLRRSRAWLQDKLWSDRGPEQGAGSLRQCLTEIRVNLGRHVTCLKTEAGWVGLDPEEVCVRAAAEGSELTDDAEFLEGLDIPDPEFEHWIRDQRMHYQKHARPGAAAGRRLTVGLATGPGGSETGAAVSGLALDLVAQSLLRFTDIGVVDLRAHAETPHGAPPAEADCLVHAAASVLGDRARVTLKLLGPGEGLLLWAETTTFDLGEFYRAEQTAAEAFADRATQSVLGQIGSPPAPEPQCRARRVAGGKC